MTIHVIRHGQSLSNVSGDLGCRFPLGIENNVLTLQGIAETIAFTTQLNADGIDIDEIICSPYTRTKQTAYTIASGLASLVPICESAHFTEIAWTYGDILALDHPKSPSKFAPVDHRLIDEHRGAYTLESPKDVFDRVIPPFIELAGESKDRNILLVTHFFVVRAIQAFMTTGSAEAMAECSPANLCLSSYTRGEVMLAAAR